MSNNLFSDNLYENTANYFDYDPRDIVKDDLDFYAEYATKTKGDILELTCGTGRVSFSLCQKTQRHLHCLDLSKTMLSKMKTKLQTLYPNLQSKINIYKGNISNFQFDFQFEYIIIPWRGLQVLPEEELAINCLKCVKSHLTDNGIFIFDIFNPAGYDRNWLGKELVSYDVTDKEKRIIRSTINHYFDNNKKYIQYISKYRIIENGKEYVLEDMFTLKYYEYDEIRDILDSLNFKIKEEYGYYNKTSIKKGSEMIFICTKI
ncbi:MAG: class I SAM-dependent methyltransferase [Endomicrobium sp.]|jgi:ubiquinone/menaquinone biosynthesis C-methylase UbiE|nr:class I SAM-dependent methyltransferase [Endomicrobium sp.]